MDKRRKLRKIALRVAQLLKNKHKVNKVFLIGSVAKGRIHKRSDIDIVVDGLPPEEYIKTLTEVYEILPPGLELNLIPFEDAFEGLKERTLKEGEILYERQRAC